MQSENYSSAITLDVQSKSHSSSTILLTCNHGITVIQPFLSHAIRTLIFEFFNHSLDVQSENYSSTATVDVQSKNHIPSAMQSEKLLFNNYSLLTKSKNHRSPTTLLTCNQRIAVLELLLTYNQKIAVLQTLLWHTVREPQFFNHFLEMQSHNQSLTTTLYVHAVR